MKRWVYQIKPWMRFCAACGVPLDLKPCPVCGTPIRRAGVLGYDAFFCPRCQATPQIRRPEVPSETPPRRDWCPLSGYGLRLVV